MTRPPLQLLVDRIAATNAADWAGWEALHDHRAVRTAPELPEPLVGRHLLRAAIERVGTAFSDYHLDLVEAVSDDRRVMARIHTSGTMTGPLVLSTGVSIPPTHRCIDQEWAALLVAHDGAIVEFHEFYDQLGLLEQLGLADLFGSVTTS